MKPITITEKKKEITEKEASRGIDVPVTDPTERNLRASRIFDIRKRKLEDEKFNTKLLQKERESKKLENSDEETKNERADDNTKTKN